MPPSSFEAYFTIDGMPGSMGFVDRLQTVFTPEQRAMYLWYLIEARRLSDTGLCVDWKGDKIDF